MNKVILTNCYIGNKGIEMKFAPGSGKAVSNYSIGVLREFSKEKEYDYFNVVTWGPNAEWLANNESRIKKINISGRLQARSYDAKDGTKRYITEIITDHVEVAEWKNEDTERGYDGMTEVESDDPLVPF